METTELKINLKNTVGKYCIDNSKGNSIFKETILNYINAHKSEDNYKITIDLEGVQVVNSSFAKSIFGNLAYKLKSDFDTHVSIIGGNPNLREHIFFFVEMGKDIKT
jgi:anti-anti-sigma regulatory factor